MKLTTDENMNVELRPNKKPGDLSWWSLVSRNKKRLAKTTDEAPHKKREDLSWWSLVSRNKKRLAKTTDEAPSSSTEQLPGGVSMVTESKDAERRTNSRRKFNAIRKGPSQTRDAQSGEPKLDTSSPRCDVMPSLMKLITGRRDAVRSGDDSHHPAGNPAIVGGHYKARGSTYRKLMQKLKRARRKRSPRTNAFSWCGCMGRPSGDGVTSSASPADHYTLTSLSSDDSKSCRSPVSEDLHTSSLTDALLTDDYDVRHKILLLGDSDVGKTSILKQLLHNKFDSDQSSTIGFDYVLQPVNVDGARVLLHIWDMPGQDRFRSLNRYYYSDIRGIVLVYDVTELESFVFMEEMWMNKIEKEIEKRTQEEIPIYIAGNKHDQDQNLHDVTLDQGREFSEQHFCNGFFAISAKTGENVKELFEKVALDVTEVYSPKLMDSYMSPDERTEKYESTNRVAPAGGLGTAQLLARQASAGSVDTDTNTPTSKHRTGSACIHNPFTACFTGKAKH